MVKRRKIMKGLLRVVPSEKSDIFGHMTFMGTSYLIIAYVLCTREYSEIKSDKKMVGV